MNVPNKTVTIRFTTNANSRKDGIVFVIVGRGGVNFYSFNGQAQCGYSVSQQIQIFEYRHQ
ncbi:MAG: hypothetical protein ACAH23_01335 [Nitrososphaeraceae archaeon]